MINVTENLFQLPNLINTIHMPKLKFNFDLLNKFALESKSLNEAKEKMANEEKLAKQKSKEENKKERLENKAKKKAEKEVQKQKKRELKKQLKSLKKQYKETKLDAEYSISGMLLLWCNILLLIPILFIGYIFLVAEGYITVRNPYRYNSDYTIAVKNSNKAFFTEFLSENNYDNAVYSPLAIQNALYYGNHLDNDIIFEYYDNGYKDYNSSNKIVNSNCIASITSSSIEDIKLKTSEFFGKSNEGLNNLLKLKSNENNLLGFCYVDNKFDMQFDYFQGYLYYFGNIKMKEINNLNIIYMPMEDNLGCYFIQSSSQDNIINSDSIRTLIKENNITENDLNYNSFETKNVMLILKPFKLSSIHNNASYINYMSGKLRQNFNTDFKNLYAISCFEIRSSDYYNQEQLSKFSDKTQELYENKDLSKMTEGIDYIIDEDGNINYNISSIKDKEFGRNSKHKVNDKAEKKVISNKNIDEKIDVGLRLDSNLAFVVFDETDNKIVMMGEQH